MRGQNGKEARFAKEKHRRAEALQEIFKVHSGERQIPRASARLCRMQGGRFVPSE
jgi:hypothetical protein